MKTITLFRHAKSEWKDSPEIADFDRPLAKRGLRDAPKMGKAMRERGIKPDLILCSSSVRTRETLERAKLLDVKRPPDVVFDERLYHAEAPAMIALLQDLPDTAAHAMIIGHNPGLNDLAVAFADSKEASDDLVGNFPTASVASFSFSIESWRDIAENSGKLMVFMAPNR